MSRIIYSSEEERIAIEYFTTVNNLVGSVALATGFTILQFKNAEPLAWFALVVFFLWAFGQGAEYKRILNRAHPASKPSIFFFLRYSWLFVIAVFFIASIAVGLINNEMFM
jgi:hypothetical protein